MLFLSFGLKAQKDTSIKFDRYENSRSGIILGYNNFPTVPNDGNTYRFNITKEWFNYDRVIRVGLDLRIDPYTTYKYYFSSYYIGYGFSFPLSKYRICPYLVGEFVIQQDLSYEGPNQRYDNRFGVAPLAGIQFNVWRWINISSELSYAASLRQTVIKEFDGLHDNVVSRRYGFSFNPRRLFSLGLSLDF